MISLLKRFLRFTERYTKTDMVYLFNSAFWINLGSISVSGFSFLLYLAFAHFLPKEVYGTYQYLLSLGAIVGAFTLTGMNSALSRSIARGYEGSFRTSVMLQIRWGIIPLVGSCAAGAYYLINGNSVLGWGLVLIGFFVPFNNALNTYGAFPGAKKDFRRAFLLNLFNNVLYYPALIIAAYFSTNALSILLVSLVVQTAILCILYTATLRIYKPNDKIDPETMRYGAHLSFMGLIGTIAGQLDGILAFHYLGAAPLAVYSFATGIPDRIASLTKFLQVAAFPKMAEREPAEVRRSILPKIAWIIVASGMIAGTYMLIADTFFRVFFPQYLDAIPYSIVYALIIIPWASGIFTTALTANKSIKSLYIFNIISPILQIVSLFVGIIYWGLWGLIIARLILATLQLVLSGILFFIHKPATIA